MNMRRLMLLVVLASIAVACASYTKSSTDGDGVRKRSDESQHKLDKEPASPRGGGY